MLETVRLSQQSKEQLLRVKRHTGIRNWNVLCRWAVCLSLSDSRPCRAASRATDSNVEMTWKTFSGSYATALEVAIRVRALEIDGLSVDECLNRHLERGIAILADRPALISVLAPTAVMVA